MLVEVPPTMWTVPCRREGVRCCDVWQFVCVCASHLDTVSTRDQLAHLQACSRRCRNCNRHVCAEVLWQNAVDLKRPHLAQVLCYAALNPGTGATAAHNCP